MLEAHWTPHGYAVPHRGRYPQQFLWDSCLHSVIWTHLGDERGLVEVESLLARATPDGFVPHMGYDGPSPHRDLWGHDDRSFLTQPPLWGHALAEWARAGGEVPASVVERAVGAFTHLIERRLRPSGLLAVWHPWETGMDDSPRWTAGSGGTWDRDRWRSHKNTMAAAVRLDAHGQPEGSAPGAGGDASFSVGSVGFTALTAFSLGELAGVTGDADLTAIADELTGALARRWRPEWATLADEGAIDGGLVDGGAAPVRTLDAALAGLVTGGEAAATATAAVVDPGAFGSPYGPVFVAAGEPTRSVGYWRGDVWPPLGWLVAVLLDRRGHTDAARSVAEGLARGAVASSWNEHWSPHDGAGLGVAPQSWTGLAAVAAGRFLR